MSLTRRAFIQSAGALAGSIALPFAGSVAAAAAPLALKAGVFRQQIRATGNPTEVWGFNGSVPGPVLRFKQGEMAHMHDGHARRRRGVTGHAIARREDSAALFHKRRM